MITEMNILLLGNGAGIRTMDGGQLEIQKDFEPLSRAARPHTHDLIRVLADKIAEDANLKCDYIAVFEDRPADVKFAVWLAGVLAAKWQQEVNVLAIARQAKHKVTFRFFRLKTAKGERTVCYNLTRLTRRAALELIGNKRVLVFADALPSDRRDGTLHILYAPALKRLKVKLVGLATFAIIHRGVRKFIAEQLSLRRHRKVTIVFVEHLGYQSSTGGQEVRPRKNLFMARIRDLMRRRSQRRTAL